MGELQWRLGGVTCADHSLAPGEAEPCRHDPLRNLHAALRRRSVEAGAMGRREGRLGLSGSVPTSLPQSSRVPWKDREYQADGPARHDDLGTVENNCAERCE